MNCLECQRLMDRCDADSGSFQYSTDIQAHLETCEACRQVLESNAGMHELIECAIASIPELGPRSVRHFVASLAQEPADRSMVLRSVAARVAAVAAVALLTVTLGALLLLPLLERASGPEGSVAFARQPAVIFAGADAPARQLFANDPILTGDRLRFGDAFALEAHATAVFGRQASELRITDEGFELAAGDYFVRTGSWHGVPVTIGASGLTLGPETLAHIEVREEAGAHRTYGVEILAGSARTSGPGSLRDELRARQRYRYLSPGHRLVTSITPQEAAVLATQPRQELEPALMTTSSTPIDQRPTARERFLDLLAHGSPIGAAGLELLDLDRQPGPGRASDSDIEAVSRQWERTTPFQPNALSVQLAPTPQELWQAIEAYDLDTAQRRTIELLDRVDPFGPRLQAVLADVERRLRILEVQLVALRRTGLDRDWLAYKLDDPDAEVRAWAVQGIRFLRDPRLQGALESRLQIENDETVRIGLIAALADLPYDRDDSTTLLPIFLDLLRAAPDGMRPFAIEGLVRHGWNRPEVQDEILGMLNDPDAACRRKALALFERHPEILDADMVRRLFAMGSDDVDVSVAISLAKSSLRFTDAAVSARLLEIADENPAFRGPVLRRYLNVEPDVQRALSLLRDLLVSQPSTALDLTVLDGVVAALGATPEVLDALVDILTHTNDRDVQEHIVSQLVLIDPALLASRGGDTRLAATLLNLVDRPVPNIGAAFCLYAMGIEDHTIFLRNRFRTARDEHLEGALELALALWVCGDRSGQAVLLEHIEDTPLTMRTLHRIAVDSITPPLLAALNDAALDPAYGIHPHVIDLLAAHDPALLSQAGQRLSRSENDWHRVVGACLQWRSGLSDATALVEALAGLRAKDRADLATRDLDVTEKELAARLREQDGLSEAPEWLELVYRAALARCSPPAADLDRHHNERSMAELEHALGLVDVLRSRIVGRVSSHLVGHTGVDPGRVIEILARFDSPEVKAIILEAMERWKVRPPERSDDLVRRRLDSIDREALLSGD